MSRIYVSFLFFISFFIRTEFSFAQVLINEVMTSNFNSFANESGHYEDWIELYNDGNSAVNLAGYGLSDNPAKPYKFTFPSYQLAAHDHVLIFADDTNVTDIGSHWESAVKADDLWRYRANTTDPGDTNWRNLSFNETVWSSGPGGFGFSDGDDATTTPVCASIFIRKSFTITDTSKILDAVFNIDYDDGFVAYLNGVEIARTNIEFPGTRPAWSTLVYSSHEAVGYQGMPIDSFHFDQAFIRSIIRNGTNVLAVQVHNRAVTESDMSCIPYLHFRIKDATVMFSPTPAWFPSNLHPKNYFHASFKLSQSGETVYLTNPSGTLVDQIAVPLLNLDNSYGRNTDAENLWKYFGTSTPDTTNNIGTGFTGYATIPVFSLQGGFYAGAQTLTLSTSFAGGVIRYTTNGDVPTTSSAVYTAPLTIGATTSVRARVFSPTSLPSATITNTYFINLNCRLPVYSLVLDSADLWDYYKGIFVKGPNASPNTPYFGANFWQDWEKYTSVEFYDKQKNRAFKFNTGLSITGGWSRRFDQKSLEVKLSDKYGLSKLQYEVLPDKKWIDKWNDFLLHTTGNDRSIAHMRDPVMERLMKGTNSDYTAYEPCILYINGALWGVYYSKENDDHHFVEENYGYGKNEIDLLKESYFFPEMEVKNGSDTAFRTMHSYAKNNSPTAPDFYATMDSMLDLKNQVDYFAAECYYPNDDWMGGSNNNLKLWRPRKDGSRFRYLLYDLDFGYGISGTVSTDILAIAMNPNPHNYNSDIFQRLLMNPKYKSYFINRYADLINTIWQQSNVINVVNGFRDSIRYDMHYQFERWGGDTNTWNNNIASMLTFSNGRPVYARNQIQSNLGMTGQVTLTLQASPPGAGRIQISTITPQTLPWSGVYFNGNPVTVTAIPNPGYTFDHWRSNVAIPANDTNRAVTRNYTVNDVITAFFTGAPTTPNVIISEINYNADSAANAGDWFELHNLTSSDLDLSGWKVKDDNDHHEFVFPVTTVLPANGYLVVAEDTSKFHAQHPAVTNWIGPMNFNLSDGGDQVRLFRYNDSLQVSVEYSDQSPWTTAADGEGYTLELLDSAGDFNDGNNWFAGCPGGSPGRAFIPTISAFTASGPLTICEGDSLVLNATTAIGNQYQWQRNHVTINGATEEMYVPAQSGTYNLVVTNNGCTVISDSMIITINPVSADPVSTSVSRCGNGSVTFTAVASDSVKWYDSGLNLTGTGSTFTTPVLSQNAVYFAQAGSVCPSRMIADTAIVNAMPSAPVTTGKNVCGHGIMTLKAISDGIIRWYDAPGGNLISTGDSMITPDLFNTTSYYAQAGDICKSVFVPATATVHPISTAPVSTGLSNCGPGSFTLLATAGDTITWYDSQQNPVGNGSAFTTPMLNQTTTYFVRAGVTCPSSMVADTIVINAVPSTPVVTSANVCGHGSMTLVATSNAPISWYDAPNGNLIAAGSSFVTPDINQSTTYYAQSGTICKSSFIPAVATVNPVSQAPSANSVSRCDAGALTIYANAPDSIYWYDAPNGTLLHTGASYQTPGLTSTATYYLRAGNVCPSSYVQVQAIISATTPDPIVPDQQRCGPGSLTLSASATDTVRWYDSPNGNLLFTGSVFVTPPLNLSTTYFVTAGNTCVSNQVAVEATINTISADPIVAGDSRCGTGSILLNAQSNEPVEWYDAPGGNLLFTGTGFVTPAISLTTTYYAIAAGICPSSFVPVTAEVISIPADPITADVSRCGEGMLLLTATGNDTIRWYDAQGGNILATGAQYTTPVISQNTTYFVRAFGVCPGNYIPVQALVNPVPADPSVIDGFRCGPGSITLFASSGDSLRWYDAPNGNLVASGSSFLTPVLSGSVTYYVHADNGCAGNDIPVQAMVHPVPPDAVTADQSRCGEGSLLLTAGAGDTIRWYDAPNGNLLWEGFSFNTPVISQSTVYYARRESVCAGNFVSVNAIIQLLPADPVVIPGSTCGPGMVVLLATSADTIGWFDAPHGSLLGTGASFQTPYLLGTTAYYVSASNGCQGNFIPVNANVFPVPEIFLGNDTIIESGSSVTMDAGAGFVSYHWNTGETTQTTVANSTGNYWVTVTDANGCSTTDTIQVMVTVNVQPYVISDGVLIYPNPTQSKLSISFVNGASEDIFLRLVDSNGKLIWSDFSVHEKRVMRTIDLEQYSKGIYMLQIATPKTKNEYKVILK